jgi:hypothetical protein
VRSGRHFHLGAAVRTGQRVHAHHRINTCHDRPLGIANVERSDYSCQGTA